ncbi:MAG TPA: tripartite tricarboxylate transporter substrate binding protein [Burkholderiales bacterium]|nr:tripartite tricarboxylate transporter substrate binding protein [Burkholderiales bacterium]
MTDKNPLLHFVAFACVLASIHPCLVHAQTYPSKPIRMIVPFAPGGPNDIIGRIVGQKLTEAWGQPIVVENRGGAGGTIGVDAGLKSPPDGYTLIVGGSSNLAVAPSLYSKLPYDPLHDLLTVSNVAFVPYVVTVNPRVPAKNLKELVAIGKTKRGSLSYGSSGAGSMSSLAAELIGSLGGFKMVHVPYKGTAPSVAAMVTGEIDLMVADYAAVAGNVKAGKLRMLATAGSKRTRAAPELPTVAESGLKGYAVDAWFGIVVPAKTPSDIVAKLSSGVMAAVKSSEVRGRFDQLGYDPIGDSSAEFSATIKSDIEKFAKIIKAAGIRIEQ